MIRSGAYKPLLAAALATILPILPATAQQPAPNKLAGAYNSVSEVRITGTVAQVTQVNAAGGLLGTHLILNTTNGKLDVHLAPPAFLHANGFELTPNDQVEVVGAPATLASGTVLLARQVLKGNRVLVIRNAQGIPQWLGGARQTRPSAPAAPGSAQ